LCGLAWGLLYGLTRGGSYAAQKISVDLCLPQMVFFVLFRSVMITFCSYLSGKYASIDFSGFGMVTFYSLPRQTQGTILQRCFFGFTSYLMAMLCVSYLPLSISASILNAAVFMTCVCGYFLAGEHVSCHQLVAITGGFAGVVLLLNPQFFNGLHMNELALKLRASHDREMYPHFYLGLVFGFLFAICSAMKFITIRAIGDNIHSSLKNYYFGLLSTLAALIACVFVAPNFFKPWLIGTPEYPLDKAQFYSSLIVGFFGWTSQESLALALGSIKSGTTAAF